MEFRLAGDAGLQDVCADLDLHGVSDAINPNRAKVLTLNLFHSVLIPVYAISLFTPTIINELGYTAANAQLLTVPPFVAGCFFTILIGIISDRCRLRGPFIILGAFVSLIGYIVANTSHKPGAGYAGAVLAAVGVYPTVAVDLAWAGGNAGGDMKRGVVIAMVIGLGNLGGICSR